MILPPLPPTFPSNRRNAVSIANARFSPSVAPFFATAGIPSLPQKWREFHPGYGGLSSASFPAFFSFPANSDLREEAVAALSSAGALAEGESSKLAGKEKLAGVAALAGELTKLAGKQPLGLALTLFFLRRLAEPLGPAELRGLFRRVFPAVKEVAAGEMDGMTCSGVEKTVLLFVVKKAAEESEVAEIMDAFAEKLESAEREDQDTLQFVSVLMGLMPNLMKRVKSGTYVEIQRYFDRMMGMETDTEKYLALERIRASMQRH